MNPADARPLMNKNQASRHDAADQAVIGQADTLVSEFERLLASELHLLKTGQANGLEAIAQAKQTLTERINALEPKLLELFIHHSESEAVTTLKQRLVQCRTDNRNNHALVMLELKHTNKSLELLRSVLNMDDLSLYSQRGEVDIKREKRRFGSA